MIFPQITIDLDVEYFPTDRDISGRNRASSVFSSRPESPTDSTDERQMLLDVEQNIANLEKTLTDSRRPDDEYGGVKDNGGGSSGKAHSKKLFSSFSSDKDAGGSDRKRWANRHKNNGQKGSSQTILWQYAATRLITTLTWPNLNTFFPCLHRQDWRNCITSLGL